MSKKIMDASKDKPPEEPTEAIGKVIQLDGKVEVIDQRDLSLVLDDLQCAVSNQAQRLRRKAKEGTLGSKEIQDISFLLKAVRDLSAERKEQDKQKLAAQLTETEVHDVFLEAAKQELTDDELLELLKERKLLCSGDK